VKVSIRPLREEDAKTSVEWRNIPELWTYTTFKADHKITIQDEINWIRKVMKDPARKNFAILADDVYIGNIYLTDLTDDSGEFHIFIGDKNYWGKGVAQEASMIAFDYASDELGLKKIILGVNPENQAAVHVYEKLGFTKFGKKDGFIRMSMELK
jgi:diamine N-acetyltransferase